MKTFLLLCSVILLLSVARFGGSSVAGQRDENQTCTITDQSIQDLGEDSVYYATGATGVDMSSAGIYTPTVDGLTTAIAIAGQAVYYPNADTVTLGNNSQVLVQWSGNNNITITDVEIIH